MSTSYNLPNNSALLIIDQQRGILFPSLGERNNPDAGVVIHALLKNWRNLGWPVIHVKHRSAQPDSVFWPKQVGFDFLEEFLPEQGEPVIEKATPCAFMNTALADLLQHMEAPSLVVVGAATNNSVEATVRTAGNMGLNVAVVEDACFAFAKADFFDRLRTADEVHGMSLANLNGEYATVIHSSLLLP